MAKKTKKKPRNPDQRKLAEKSQTTESVQPMIEREQYLQAMEFIRRYGDPVLRSQAREVDAFGAPLMELADQMITLMYATGGVGLAAPQVGDLRRVIVIRTDLETDDHSDALLLVNPVIVESSEETETQLESCLSLPGIAVEVERPVSIKVEAVSPIEGEPIDAEIGGYLARIVQHEIDHLDGKMIFNRTTDEQRKGAMKALREGGSYVYRPEGIIDDLAPEELPEIEE